MATKRTSENSLDIVGIALGAGLGGRVADTLGLGVLASVSAVLTLGAGVALAASQRWAARARPAPPCAGRVNSPT